MRPRIRMRPTKVHLDQTEAWLQAEYKEYGEGFYCNWNVITNAFDKHEMAVALLDEEAVGFMVWWAWRDQGGLDILSVRPPLRRHGIGSSLTKHILAKFSKSGVARVEIECQPFTSEPFWRKFGFVDDPKHPYKRINGIPEPSLHLQLFLSQHAL